MAGPRQFLDSIGERVGNIDGILVLIAAGPPCPNFSMIQDDPSGHDGEEGAKFVQAATLARELREESPFQVEFLFENVLMNTEALARANMALGCEPFVADAADWGMVMRRRLWWSSLDLGPHLTQVKGEHLLHLKPFGQHPGNGGRANGGQETCRIDVLFGHFLKN